MGELGRFLTISWPSPALVPGRKTGTESSLRWKSFKTGAARQVGGLEPTRLPFLRPAVASRNSLSAGSAIA